MKVIIPNNNLCERKYIIYVLLADMLHLDFEILLENNRQDTTIIWNDKKLIFKDAFWNCFPKDLEYLSESNIPQTISWGTVDAIKGLPIIFGEDLCQIASNEITCGVDIFAGAFFMMTRWEEYVLQRENTGLCNEKQLLCVKEKLTQRPIVNEYICLLIDLLRRIGVSAKEPDLYKVMLTHDVDRCYLSSWSVLMKNLIPLALKQHQYKKAYTAFKNFLLYKIHFYNPFLPFNELMDYSDKYNIKNHFYFKACVPSEIGFTYSVTDNVVQKEIQNIIKREHCVGFHPSESTFGNDNQFVAEIERLKAIMGMSITIEGGRNHSLYCNTQTLSQWEKSCSYMSNFGYQYRNGFRCGICFPFKMFNVFTQQTLNLIEIPFVAMDSVAIRNKWTPEELWTDVQNIISTVKKYKGIVCLNWHSNTFNTMERRAFKSTYFNIVDYAARK